MGTVQHRWGRARPHGAHGLSGAPAGRSQNRLRALPPPLGEHGLLDRSWTAPKAAPNSQRPRAARLPTVSLALPRGPLRAPGSRGPTLEHPCSPALFETALQNPHLGFVGMVENRAMTIGNSRGKGDLVLGGRGKCRRKFWREEDRSGQADWAQSRKRHRVGRDVKERREGEREAMVRSVSQHPGPSTQHGLLSGEEGAVRPGHGSSGKYSAPNCCDHRFLRENQLRKNKKC